MRSLVEAYHEAVGVYVKLATSLDKLAVELFGFRFVEPMQPGGQPPIAAIRQDGQRDIDVHIEPHFTGQAIEVKEIDTDPQAVLYTIAASIADEQVSGTDVKVVGHHEGELGAPQPVHGQLPYWPIVPAECHGFVHIADVLMAAFGDIQDGSVPGLGREGM